MNKRDALRLNEVALNFIDLVHCMHSGSANEISFDAWQDMFARGKDYEAARKQWQRWKRDLDRHGLIERVEDGREDHVIVKPKAKEIAEELHAQAQAVLEEGREQKRTYPDEVTFEGSKGERVTFFLKVYGRDIPLLDDRQYEELKASIAADGIQVMVEVDRKRAVVDGKNRLVIAHVLKIPLDKIPIHVREETDRATLERIAAELNDKRRHYTRQQLAERRRVRQESARAKLAGGMSTRQIAKKEGVSQTQILRDLGEASRGRPSRKERQAERRAKIVELLAKKPDLTVRKLVEELGYSSVGTISKDIKALAKGVEHAAAHADGHETPPFVIAEGASTGARVLGVDPESDGPRPCLEAALSGVEHILAKVQGTELQGMAEAVHKIIETMIWRLVEADMPA